MKPEASAVSLGPAARIRALGWPDLLAAIRRFPQRLRERQFWYIQLLVCGATAPHYVIETLGYSNPFETLHGLSITLYVVPLLYAALSYGWEGAILTSLWAALLTSPSTWIWERTQFHWFAEVGQLLITLPVGILVAWRVTLETEQRQRAEATSASLSLLNDVGKTVGHTLEVEQQLPKVVRRLLEGLALESVWLYLEAESEVATAATVASSSSPRHAPSAAVVRELHLRLAGGPTPLLIDGRMVAVPVAGEAGTLGSLGATVPDGETLSSGQIEVLTTVANQLRVALENARLYRQRQESLQSYVRQVTQAQEEERLRIARELHDETAQELVHIVRGIEQLRGQASPGLEQPFEDLLSMTRNTIKSVRRFSQDLRPSVLDDLGLVAALEVVVDQSNRYLPAGARLQVSGKPRRLDGPVELALFRICQEALRNVEKHASAGSAKVNLDFHKSDVRLCVSDDGDGFSAPGNVSDLASVGKLGVLGMKERAQLVGGRFELRSSPGAGTQVTVRVVIPVTA